MVLSKIDPDEPLFGIPKDKWMLLPLPHREEGHRLTRELIKSCRKLGIEPPKVD